MGRAFVLVGAPAMGKSSLLREIPSVIELATCIDLENASASTSTETLLSFVEDVMRITWRGPLFVGCGNVNPMGFAEIGFEVIGLHHENEAQYRQRMRDRDLANGWGTQGDFWASHRRLLTESMPARDIQPFMVDTCHSELDGQIDKTIRMIAKKFDLPTMPRKPLN